MYFALAGVMDAFHYLRFGLAAILSFVGVKMLIADFYEIPTAWALGVVGLMLLVSIVVSLALKPRAALTPALSEAGDKAVHAPGADARRF